MGRLPQLYADMVEQGRVLGIVKGLDYWLNSSMVKKVDYMSLIQKGKTMPVIKAQDAKVFEIPNVTFYGMAAPSRGAVENAVWRVKLAPGTAGSGHSLTREEVLVALSGTAVARIGGVDHAVAEGDVVVVPADTEFALSNPGDLPFEAIAILPVGGQACMGPEQFVPPWAA